MFLIGKEWGRQTARQISEIFKLKIRIPGLSPNNYRTGTIGFEQREREGGGRERDWEGKFWTSAYLFTLHVLICVTQNQLRLSETSGSHLVWPRGKTHDGQGGSSKVVWKTVVAKQTNEQTNKKYLMLHFIC